VAVRRAPFARPILTHLRAVSHDAHPALDESIRWGMPRYVRKAIKRIDQKTS
jgi:hypothetical protein